MREIEFLKQDAKLLEELITLKQERSVAIEEEIKANLEWIQAKIGVLEASSNENNYWKIKSLEIESKCLESKIPLNKKLSILDEEEIKTKIEWARSEIEELQAY